MGLLAEWMTRKGETDQSLAPKVGISRVHVSRLRRVVHNPSPDLAKKIESVTKIPAAKLVFEARRDEAA
jgi:transcriptional regulator with XRE-family HTH domain